MTAAEFLVDYLVKNGVSDVFGIPGGVVLDFLYALDNRKEMSAHLSCHEQGAAFEAIGYSQYNHSLGAAYATRGPGFTNMITGIADAYSDSVPVVFITAHSGKSVGNSKRFEKDQELNTVSMVSNITKYAAVIEDTECFCEKVETAFENAMNGRKGPVLLDISADIWNKEVIDKFNHSDYKSEAIVYDIENIMCEICRAKRPIILVGDGIRQSNTIAEFVKFADKINIPVLSSRGSQDVGAACKNYYGYIGSHGLRYSNFIFAKSDLVIALGNRLSFPINSKSFLSSLSNKQIVRVELDKKELQLEIPNLKTVYGSVKTVLDALNKAAILPFDNGWLVVCEALRSQLKNYDSNIAVQKLEKIFSKVSENNVMCCDVGNNEFWVSSAYVNSNIKNRILYSKQFGTLGCAVPKSIGAFYASRQPVLCFTGDQGLQLNVQELQLISQNKLPITIVVLNNNSSGMIRSRQKAKYNAYYVHTTKDSGYFSPDIKRLAYGYNIKYLDFDSYINTFDVLEPVIVEVNFDEDIDISPSLPAGNSMDNMTPLLPKKILENIANIGGII